MRKCLAISFVMLMAAAEALACGGGMTTHHYYLFSVFCRETMYQPLFSNRLDEFWKSYTNGAVEKWQWHEKEIADYAKSRGDKEMTEYLVELGKYLDISQQLGETWDYPTKEQLQERQQNLTRMIVKADAHRGGRLTDQWKLLRMRANMVLGKHEANIRYWEQTASKLQPSVYKDMMENIYAGALLNTGKRIEACNAFAKQEDMLSMKWGMRKYRNIAGIKAIYAEDPNMPVLNYLVQDFVNNAQETLDSYATDEDGNVIPVDDEWMRMVDARVANKEDVNEFVSFANTVLQEGKTKSPALWKAAIGELQYLYGKYDEAMKTLDEAMTLDGTQRMKDNARAIRMVASAGSSRFAKKDYQKWVVGEMKWVAAKKQEEPGEYNHYSEVLDRFVYEELVPRYQKSSNKNLATALVALFHSSSDIWKEANPTEYFPEDDNWNYNYSGDYYYALSTMSGDELAAYYKWLTKSGKGELEKWAKSVIGKDANYYNDLIGTHYMAEGRFDKAIDYLKNIPTNFLEGQNINFYMAKRDYAKPRWMGRQTFGEGVRTEGANLATMTNNPKLEFCKDIVSMEAQLPIARKGVKEEIAYKLATRYFQASVYGDCWYLTDYGWSSYIDTLTINERRFVDKTVEYLNISKESTDMQLKLESLYALAYIPVEPWCEEDYDWATGVTSYLPLRKNSQYVALKNLEYFIRNNQSMRMPAYVSKCDVLKQFRKTL